MCFFYATLSVCLGLAAENLTLERAGTTTILSKYIKGIYMLKVNSKHESNKNGRFIIKDYIDCDNVVIEFELTGFVKVVKAVHAKSGSVRDPLYPSLYGVGFIGAGKYSSRKNNKTTKVYQAWADMMRRGYCKKYKSKNKSYHDVIVCDEWHNFQNFADWYVINHIDGCELDKDIKKDGNIIYSPSTCLFVSHQENSEKASAKEYAFISPDKEVVSIYNMSAFCRENNLCYRSMSLVHLGKKYSYKSWKSAKHAT